jgi:magnesium chelatase family protein
MNLCPCGGRGDGSSQCACSPQRIARYREKLSRALLDRIDLVVTVPRPRAEELAASAGESSEVVIERVLAARRILREAPPVRAPETEELLTRAVERLSLSGRGRSRMARVAATIAALAGAEVIAPDHLSEALSYRTPRELTS